VAGERRIELLLARAVDSGQRMEAEAIVIEEVEITLVDRGLPRVDHQETASAVRGRLEGFFSTAGVQCQDADAQKDRALQELPGLHSRLREPHDSSRGGQDAISWVPLMTGTTLPSGAAHRILVSF